MVALWMAKSNIIYDLISVLDLTPLVWFCFVLFCFFSFLFFSFSFEKKSYLDRKCLMVSGLCLFNWLIFLFFSSSICKIIKLTTIVATSLLLKSVAKSVA
jgi:hypothetical protein